MSLNSENSRLHVKVDCWTLKKKIGSGSFAKVYLGVAEGETISDKPRRVAIKSINASKLSSKLRSNLEAEIRILRNVKHPNIVSLHGIHKSSSHVYLLMEYCEGGDLHQIIRNHSPLSPTVVKHFLKQLASGISFLSAKGMRIET